MDRVNNNNATSGKKEGRIMSIPQLRVDNFNILYNENGRFLVKDKNIGENNNTSQIT